VDKKGKTKLRGPFSKRKMSGSGGPRGIETREQKKNKKKWKKEVVQAESRGADFRRGLVSNKQASAIKEEKR